MVKWSLRVVLAVGVIGLMAMPSALSQPVEEGEGASFGLLDRSILRVHEGDYRVRLDGTVVENLEIRGTLRIIANDVIVRNVWVYGVEPWTILVENGSATFEHVEIGHPDFVGERGIGGDNVTARYLDIHHVEDGIKTGNNSLYEYIHVHSLDSLSDNPHADALQDDGGTTNFTIRYSILDSTGPLGLGNAAVLIKSDLGPISGFTLEGNHFNGGAYAVFVRDGGKGDPQGGVFIGNSFGSDYQFGLIDIPGRVRWEGNYLHATGEEVKVDGTLGEAPAGYQPSTLPTPPSVPATTVPEGGTLPTTENQVTPPARTGLEVWVVVVVGLGAFFVGLFVMSRMKQPVPGMTPAAPGDEEREGRPPDTGDRHTAGSRPVPPVSGQDGSRSSERNVPREVDDHLD